MDDILCFIWSYLLCCKSVELGFIKKKEIYGKKDLMLGTTTFVHSYKFMTIFSALNLQLNTVCRQRLLTRYISD